MTQDAGKRSDRARRSLDGLSVGDAFGERFFLPDAKRWLVERELPTPPEWAWTDDTALALALVDHLESHGEVVQGELASDFAARYHEDPYRGYGGGMHELFRNIASGTDWAAAVSSLFDGAGSFGNGAAMRVAPLGAWFADDLERAASQATLQARVTHAHPEGAAGAVAVAVAAGAAWQHRESDAAQSVSAIWDAVLEHTPESDVRHGLVEARDLDDDTTVTAAAETLGNGARVTAQDTVPFVVWSATRALDDYPEAMWRTASGLGDIDTTCAMVGGIVALRDAPPARWLSRREALG